MPDRQPSEAIPATPEEMSERLDAYFDGTFEPLELATPDPRAEAERYLSGLPAITPGPWHVSKIRRYADIHGEIVSHLARVPIDSPEGQANAEFIAAAPQLVRALLAALTAKDEELRSLREASAGAQWQPIETAPKGDGVIVWWPEYSKRPCSAIQQQDGQWRAGGGEPTSKPRLWWPLPSPPGAPAATSQEKP